MQIPVLLMMATSFSGAEIKYLSVTIPDLQVNWITEVDPNTCFSVHQYEDTYFSHGETIISRIDRAGNIVWQYGGTDAFLCMFDGNPFEMRENHISLTDFNGSRYRIDYDGRTIDYLPALV